MKIIHPTYGGKKGEGRPRCPVCHTALKPGRTCPNCGRKKVAVIKDGPEKEK